MTDRQHTPENEEKLDFKKVLPIFIIVLIDLLGLTIIIPVLPLYAVAFGANATMYGLLGTAYPVMQFLGAPILGRLSDRIGRRPVLIISQIGTMAGFLIMGFSGGLLMLFVARIIDGISGANISTAQAVITDSTNEKTRTQGLGLIGAAFGLGFIIGPIIAFIALTLSNNNYAVPAFVAAAFSFMSILLSYFWLEETLPPSERGKTDTEASFSIGAMVDMLSKPGIGILLILMFFQQLAFGGMEVMLALFTLNRLGMDASDNSALFVFIGVIVVAVQGYFVGKWSKRLGDRRLIYLGLATLAVGLALTTFTPRIPLPGYDQAAMTASLSESSDLETTNVKVDLPPDTNRGWMGLGWLLVAMVPMSIGGGILQPSINSLITKRVEADDVGGTLGISTSFYSAANATAPLVMGFLFDQLSPGAPFLVGGVIMAVMLAITVVQLKPDKEGQASDELSPGHPSPY